MVDFINDYIDEGNVAETNVDGVACIERISDGQMRVSYYRRRKGEKVVVAHFVWDRQEWLKMWHVWAIHQDEINHQCLEIEWREAIGAEIH
jgi:hypothetical protein